MLNSQIYLIKKYLNCKVSERWMFILSNLQDTEHYYVISNYNIVLYYYLKLKQLKRITRNFPEFNHIDIEVKLHQLVISENQVPNFWQLKCNKNLIN